jgi:hypothetical protein
MADHKWPPEAVKRVGAEISLALAETWLAPLTDEEAAFVGSRALTAAMDLDDRPTAFAMRLGYVMGGLISPDIKDDLILKGVTQDQIDEASRALSVISGAFYR